MNTTLYKSTLEAKFATSLEYDRLEGRIAGFHYEHFHLRLPGEKNFYKPDFFVWGNGKPIFYEVKGWSRSNDRSLVKLKVANLGGTRNEGLTGWATYCNMPLQRRNG